MHKKKGSGVFFRPERLALVTVLAEKDSRPYPRYPLDAFCVLLNHGGISPLPGMPIMAPCAHKIGKKNFAKFSNSTSHCLSHGFYLLGALRSRCTK